MELMISAASPRQMLTGKVVGIGAAGLTQYVAIAVPALLLIAFQDRIAESVLGPGWAEGAPLVGLSAGLLAAYGVFFLLGFVLFALIYAAMGSFVSRPDDLQTLSLPLSLLATVGYLTAIVALGFERLSTRRSWGMLLAMTLIVLSLAINLWGVAWGQLLGW